MKKKKRKKIKIIVTTVLLVAAMGGGGGYYYYRSHAGNEELEIEVLENQTLLTGQVSSITGNDMVLALAKEVDMSSERTQMQRSKGGDAENSEEASAEEFSERPQMSQDTGQSGEMSAETSAMPQGGEMPSDMSEMPQGGQMPSDMSEMPQGGEMLSDRQNMSQERGEKSDSNSKVGNAKEDEDTDKKEEQTMYQLTGEEKELRIPVGTTVTTQLGKQTTFSRISAEDMVKVLVETNDDGEEVVVGVWIVG